jgi:hypothetical protein
MRYAFTCPNGCAFEANAPAKDDGLWPEVAGVATCPQHGIPGQRDYATEFASQGTVCDDEIRRAYLGSKIDFNLQAQGRPLDPLAPRDRFEAKHVERALGRIHIGDDYSMLRPNAQRAIERGGTKPGKLVVG